MVTNDGGGGIVQFAPAVIVLLVVGVATTLFYLFGDKAVAIVRPFAKGYAERLERASIRKFKAEDLAIFILLTGSIAWALFDYLIRPPLLLAILCLPAFIFAGHFLVGKWVDIKRKRRLTMFNNQLELILRMLSSSIRAGLGMRQAMVIITEELPDPARYEFALTIAQMNVGLSTNDALLRLSQRMPSQEIDMFVRAVAVQSQTGGNLSGTLDHLATTIKDRRRLMRKVKAITAESRGSAYILGGLPIAVGGLILLLEPQMREPLISTSFGRIDLAIACSLEGMGMFVLSRLIQFKV